MNRDGGGGRGADTAKRRYRKNARAHAEAATHTAILDAALAAFTQESFDRVTLTDIARDAGVTVQTVIRHFGSKEELFARLAEREEKRVLEQRQVPDDAGRDAALDALLDHYERDGDTIVNFVAQEHRFEPIRHIVEKGRRVHRAWVDRHCRDLLDGRPEAERERVLRAATVATDLGTWKLLRRDFGLDRSAVRAVMVELLEGLRRRS